MPKNSPGLDPTLLGREQRASKLYFDQISAAFLGISGLKLRILFVSTALKVLLIPAYRSTDFEVHRNWMAIVHSLPLAQWYTENTSEWTLDYPPLFAWFEWLLSRAARLADPAMLQVSNLNYASNNTILFQRGSVIFTDLVLASGTWYATRTALKGHNIPNWKLSRSNSNLVFLLVVLNPGLLIVDHIHFQYNGFLLGILVWSFGCAIEGKDLIAGLLFAMLLNLKHIFSSLAPVYFVYLLRHFCRGENAKFNFLQLGVGVLSVFAISFGPFIEEGKLTQVLHRLFPFGRGLCHAYWAPNAWALYAAMDKGFVFLFKLLEIPVNEKSGNLTGGLVGATKFAVLPSIPPWLSLLLVITAMLPVLVGLWRNPNPIVFLKAATYASFCSFMLGYHVHEKAILSVVIPMALGATAHRRAAGEYIFLSTVSTFSLFPLLFTSPEYLIKILLLCAYIFMASILLNASVDAEAPAEEPAGREKPLRSRLLVPEEILYLLGLVAVEVYSSWLHPLLMAEKLPFLPLMLISVYCAAGLTYLWAQPDTLLVQTVKQD